MTTPTFLQLLAARPATMAGPIMYRSRFAAFVKLAKAPGCYIDLADPKLTKGERRHLEALTQMMARKGRGHLFGVPDEAPFARRSAFGKKGIELTVAGINLFNGIVDDATLHAEV